MFSSYHCCSSNVGNNIKLHCLKKNHNQQPNFIAN